jgi:hypothetical protein
MFRTNMKTAGILIAGALLGAGCSSFQDVTTVQDLRVLGIMAEPAEIYVTLDDSGNVTSPDSITSTITALVVDPKGMARPVSYSVLACPRDVDTVTAASGKNGVICQPNVPGQTPTSLEVTPADPPDQTTDAGPEHDIAVPFSVPPALLSQAFMIDTPAAKQGFQLPVTIQFQLSAGTESIVATKRLIFSQQITDRPPQAPNQNPTLTMVQAYPPAAADAAGNPISMDTQLPEGAAPIEVPLGSEMFFLPEGFVAESYSTRVLTRDNPPQVVTKDVPAESLRFAFFATAGTFTPSQTSTVSATIFNASSSPALQSKYQAPSTMPDDPNVTIWIVTRDERGGASWTSRQITLVP